MFSLTPDNFGYDYFVDPDGDLFENFEIVSTSQISSFLQFKDNRTRD